MYWSSSTVSAANVDVKVVNKHEIVTAIADSTTAISSRESTPNWNLVSDISHQTKNDMAPILHEHVQDDIDTIVYRQDQQRKTFFKTLNSLNADPRCRYFIYAVDPNEYPDYYTKIQNPMDLQTVLTKLNGGLYDDDPWKFIADIRLIFRNAKMYNKKNSWVHKWAIQLDDNFVDEIDQVMRQLGYCCGKEYEFTPYTHWCYSGCIIKADEVYYSFEESYFCCARCFRKNRKNSNIEISDDMDITKITKLPKSQFIQLKNSDRFPECRVLCKACRRLFHSICVLHNEAIEKEFTCKNCLVKLSDGAELPDNSFSASKLPESSLSFFIQTKVNNYLERRDPTAAKVVIRVMCASDEVVEMGASMKRKVKSAGKFPYRSKTVFAFQEMEGAEVAFFAFIVQEYGNAPEPNHRKIYLSYLDSVHFFSPRYLKTEVYHEIILAYLENAKSRGYEMAFLWASPPAQEGTDYIFFTHPPEQKIPRLRRLQDWYKVMLDKGQSRGVLLEHQNMFHHCTNNQLMKVSEIPYFEGDFWPGELEKIITYVENDLKKAKRSYKAPSNKKGNSHNLPKKCDYLFQNKSNTDLAMFEAVAEMHKKQDMFLVTRLQTKDAATYCDAHDEDLLISCEILENRDRFLNFCKENNCEFSSLRRAKYATMKILYQIHSEKETITCNFCLQLLTEMDVRFECKTCIEFDLCMRCFCTKVHFHPLVKVTPNIPKSKKQLNSSSELDLEKTKSSWFSCTKVLLRLEHARVCLNSNNGACGTDNCESGIKILKHMKRCREKALQVNYKCNVCSELGKLSLIHAKKCTQTDCSLFGCSSFKNRLALNRIRDLIRNARGLPPPVTNEMPRPTPTPIQDNSFQCPIVSSTVNE